MKKSKEKDFEIIKQIKEGDTLAFHFLVEKYKDVSFSLACSILSNEHEAEEALQESFIKVYKAINGFRFQSSFATWLYKIVVNTCNTRCNVLQRQQKHLNLDADEQFEIPDNTSVFGDLILSDQKTLVNNVLDLLKPEESLMLRLFYLAEMSIIEIKKITGYKDSRIKVTLFRARKSFRIEFEKIYGKEMILNL